MFEDADLILRKVVFKLLRVVGGCLGIDRRRRTRIPAKSHGEPERGSDPWISEWGNPTRVMPCYSKESDTHRTETSK